MLGLHERALLLIFGFERRALLTEALRARGDFAGRTRRERLAVGAFCRDAPRRCVG